MRIGEGRKEEGKGGGGRGRGEGGRRGRGGRMKREKRDLGWSFVKNTHILHNNILRGRRRERE